MGSVTFATNAFPSQDISGASGLLAINGGATILGQKVGGLLWGGEKITFIIKVTALGAGTSLILKFYGSIDATNVTSSDPLATRGAITSTGNYALVYNGTPIQAGSLAWTLTGGTTTATLSVDVSVEGDVV